MNTADQVADLLSSVSETDLRKLGNCSRAELQLATQVLGNPWIPREHTPTPKQAEFLTLPNREAFYGGAAGGGKSDALLTGALMYVTEPGYAGILFRRSYADLALPGALMDRAQEWLGGTDASWNGTEKTWTFPSGATLTFGYLQTEKDKYRYQSAEFQYVGFDELTQFTLSQYRYLFSRLRRLKGSRIPIRMRSASNPGGEGHEWVKEHFLEEGPEKGRPFIPARLEDNPHLDVEEYERSLEELDPVTRAQLRHGDWEVSEQGTKFQRHWFEVVEDYPHDAPLARFWDLAATEPKPGKDPDWTAGAKLALKDGIWYVVDVQRDRTTPKGVQSLIKQTAQLDGKATRIGMEQEPGASGKSEIDRYRREILVGYDFKGYPPSGSKEVRANPVSSAAEAGNVKLVRGPWIEDYLDELAAFPQGGHDDQVDATSGAFNMLTGPYLGTGGTSRKRTR
jgi:predicted phage terminase large subunit-like protein